MRSRKIERQSQLESFLKGILACMQQKQPAATPLPLIGHVCRYVANNITDCNISVASVAEHFGVPQTRPATHFVKECGMPLYEYIQTLRMELIKHFLRQGETDMESIARKSGFFSAEELPRSFYRENAMFPGRYRRLVGMAYGEKMRGVPLQLRLSESEIPVWRYINNKKYF
ncbi:MAG: AraC family transcriptional regulator [Clostridia bacterium]|nr:AraC family transcriptional regulator [Clostridia bacterium]